MTTATSRRFIGFAAAVGIAAAGMIGVGTTQAAHLVNSVTYSGQGIDDDGNIEEVICDANNTPYVLFVLAGTKASEAVLVGDVAGSMTKSGEGNGGAFKLTSGNASDLLDLIGNVTALYDGPARNAQLVISHGCPGDDQPPS